MLFRPKTGLFTTQNMPENTQKADNPVGFVRFAITKIILFPPKSKKC